MLEAEHESIKAMLNTLLNQPPTHTLGVALEYWSPERHFNYAILEGIALRERSELQGMQAMVEEQQLLAKLAQREVFPDVTVAVGYERMNKRFMGRRDDAWTAAISFNLPIWFEQRQLREVKEAEAQAEANKDVLEAMTTMIKGNIRQLIAKIRSVQDRLAIYESGLLSKSEETLATAASKYRADKGNFLILLDSQRQLKNVELGYMQTKVEKEVLLAELERAVGVDLKGIL
jgi:outer membrane protein TolC